MNGKARILFVFVLMILASGCAGRPLFSVEVFLTPTFTPIASDPIDVQPTLPPASTPDLPEPMSTPESPGLSNNSAVTMPPIFHRSSMEKNMTQTPIFSCSEGSKQASGSSPMKLRPGLGVSRSISFTHWHRNPSRSMDMRPIFLQ